MAIKNLFHPSRSYVCHFIVILEFKLELLFRNSQIRAKSSIFRQCNHELWWMTLKNYGAPLPCYSKLCATFRNHLWIQTGVTVWSKLLIRIKVCEFIVTCDLKSWWMTLKTNRAPVLCHLKLWASFHNHLRIQTGVMIRKCPNWGNFIYLCNLDLWLRTLRFCAGITFVNGNCSWQSHDDRNIVEKVCVCEHTDRRADGRTDRQTDREIHRAPWSELKHYDDVIMGAIASHITGLTIVY